MVKNQEKRTFVTQISLPVRFGLPPIPQNLRLNYLFFSPDHGAANAGEKLPLIIFLHGIGERGDQLADLDRVALHGLPRVVEENPNFSFIIVSPQCPEQTFWPVIIEPLDHLLDHILKEHPVDESRIYLTGLSMGGYGTWSWAVERPDRFAAIAPVAGGYHPETSNSQASICVLKDLPIWAFHGAQDEVVLPEESISLVKELEACGGNIRFTLYPHARHDSWTETYQNPRLYEWFLSHRRQDGAGSS